MKRIILCLLLITYCLKASEPAFIDLLHVQPGERDLVEQVCSKMSLEQKIGQLFMPRCNAGSLIDNGHQIKRFINDFHIGGIIFMTSDAKKQIELTNEFQELSQVPLLIGLDAENGVAMRHTSLPGLPQQLMLGAVEDDFLVIKYGHEVARQCRRLGVHVNFAPVADVNNNPLNPIIGNRSFGQSVVNVASKSIAYMQGLHEGGVLACFKHFPGHGDTTSDSHTTLPIITHDRKRLDEIELMPFKTGIQSGIAAVMTAHLQIPALDDTPDIPSSLSKKIVTNLLQKEFGFKGLIFTDGLQMKGVREFYTEPGQAECEAFKAGNHILLDPAFLEEAFFKIKEAVQKDHMLAKLLEMTVRKILHFKYCLGLPLTTGAISIEHLESDLINQEFYDLKKEIIENALTYVGDNQEVFRALNVNVQKHMNGENTKNIALVNVNPVESTVFQSFFMSAGIHTFRLDDGIQEKDIVELLAILKNYEHVIIAVHNMNRNGAKRFGILESTQNSIKTIVHQKPDSSIVVLFGTPYAASYFKECPHSIVAYNADPMTQDITAQKLLNGSNFIGVLPVSL
ncbi:hypothetical protein EBU24_03085 [bacterium]|nr:hypothetical protein [bacterium]